jgi:hypothetical protein
MRVAFSGSHRVGKTTLIEAVAESRPGYVVLDEPYLSLEEEGHELSDPPCLADFERQLARCLELTRAAPADALLDRCPLDFVAYMETLGEADAAEAFADEIRDAVERLDLIVVVPIEEPERIALAAHEDGRWRRRVDARLRPLVLDDLLGLGTISIEVHGTVRQRARQVRRAIDGP